MSYCGFTRVLSLRRENRRRAKLEREVEAPKTESKDVILKSVADDLAGKPKDWQFNENDLNLFDERGNINYEQVKQLGSRIVSGESKVVRLNEREEQGRILGGSRNVEASLLIGASQSTSGTGGSRAQREREEKLLEEYASIRP
jgi:hypothetical protein